MIKIKRLIMFVLLLFLYAAVFSFGGESVYSIRDVSFQIDGSTSESVLRHYLNIIPGTEFSGAEELQSYLSEKQQLIANQRTIAEGRIDAFYEPDSGSAGLIFVDLVVIVSDTWNYFILPYAKLDSNTGFLLSLRGRNYNFLGRMKTLAVDLDYTKLFTSGSEYSAGSRFAYPFYLWDYNWIFDFDGDVTVSSVNPLYAYSRFGVTVDIPLDHLTWQASVNQYYYLNEDGADDADGFFMKTAARFGSSIPLGLNIPGVGEVRYSPGIITNYAYKPFGTLSEERKGYDLGTEHELSAGQIDWQGNFRDGTEVSVYQMLKYNFTRRLWLGYSDFEIQYHKAFGWGGFSSRLKGFYLYNDTGEDLGEPIRGVLNNRLDGNGAFYLNCDFPLKLWVWFLDPWVEGHISPFFDVALVKPENGKYNLSDAWYGGGLEGFVFFKDARSIYLRASLGVDLQAVAEGAGLGDPAPRDGASIYEVFIGLGHHY